MRSHMFCATIVVCGLARIAGLSILPFDPPASSSDRPRFPARIAKPVCPRGSTSTGQTCVLRPLTRDALGDGCGPGASCHGSPIGAPGTCCREIVPVNPFPDYPIFPENPRPPISGDRPSPFPDGLSTEGLCPSDTRTSCAAVADSCQSDTDCATSEVCCRDACGKSCKRARISLLDILSNQG